MRAARFTMCAIVAAAGPPPCHDATAPGFPGSETHDLIVEVRTNLEVPSLAVIDLRTGGLRAFPSAGMPMRDPSPSPDGSRVAFVSEAGGNVDIYVINRDGTGLARLTTDAARDDQP